MSDSSLDADGILFALRETLDALELMVQQYLSGNGEGGYDHDFMTAGERALAVLDWLRPDRWTLDSTGADRAGLPVIPWRPFSGSPAPFIPVPLGTCSPTPPGRG